MGKTAVLESIRGTLQDDPTLKLAGAQGAPQEAHRPFYLAVQLLGQLLQRERDGGKAILENLDPEELGYLGELLPQLHAEDKPASETPSPRRREGLFHLTRFLVIHVRLKLVIGKHFAGLQAIAVFGYIFAQSQVRPQDGVQVGSNLVIHKHSVLQAVGDKNAAGAISRQVNRRPFAGSGARWHK